MSGSIALSAMAALKSGSGLVSAVVPDRCLETVASFHPAVMTTPVCDDDRGRFGSDAAAQIAKHLSAADAVGIGPGMTTGPGSLRIVERWVGRRGSDSANNRCVQPMVVDADGLNCVAELGLLGGFGGKAGSQPHLNLQPKPERFESVVLTPHAGELQRLTGTPASDRAAQVDAARRLADRTGVTIVVKGGPSIVVGGDQSWTCDTGNPGMATAGTGDVLTGVITSLLGQGMSPWSASCLAVWVHGRAGDIAAARVGTTSMTALDVMGSLSDAFRGVSPR
jgi:NAD(P)H-hydrate epimerase